MISSTVRFRSPTFAVGLYGILALSATALAETDFPGLSPQGDADSVRSSVKEPGYSPYAGRNFPTRVYWGDTHVHTDNSLDANGFGARIGPEEALRFARGEEVVSSSGVPMKLSRPLDWLVVADHSDGMGAMKEIRKGNPRLLADPTVRDWYNKFREGGETAFQATMDVINAFSQGTTPEVVLDREFQQTVWDEYIDITEQYNEPGRFTAMIGYEWTSTEDGINLHRNVLYRDDGDVARRMVPYTTAESFNPEDLWKWMARYEESTGGRVLALAHNGNMSNGIMFPYEINPATGKRLTGDYAEQRARWEPLYEVTQIKGDGETHPLMSPDDEFADFETLALGNLNLTVVKTDEMIRTEYARQALRDGLMMEEKLGTNPYKFGMVGSTDTHTALSAAEEENYIGKHAGTEPSAERWNHPMAKFAGSPVRRLRDVGVGVRRRVGDRQHPRSSVGCDVAQGSLRDNRAAHARTFLRRLGLRGAGRAEPAAGRDRLHEGRADGRGVTGCERRPVTDVPGCGAEGSAERQPGPDPGRQGLVRKGQDLRARLQRRVG